MPLLALMDSIEGGDTLDAFLEDLPTVTREHAVSALRLAEQLLTPHAHLA